MMPNMKTITAVAVLLALACTLAFASKETVVDFKNGTVFKYSVNEDGDTYGELEIVGAKFGGILASSMPDYENKGKYRVNQSIFKDGKLVDSKEKTGLADMKAVTEEMKRISEEWAAQQTAKAETEITKYPKGFTVIYDTVKSVGKLTSESGAVMAKSERKGTQEYVMAYLDPYQDSKTFKTEEEVKAAFKKHAEYLVHRPTGSHGPGLSVHAGGAATSVHAGGAGSSVHGDGAGREVVKTVNHGSVVVRTLKNGNTQHVYHNGAIVEQDPQLNKLREFQPINGIYGEEKEAAARGLAFGELFVYDKLPRGADLKQTFDKIQLECTGLFDKEKTLEVPEQKDILRLHERQDGEMKGIINIYGERGAKIANPNRKPLF